MKKLFLMAAAAATLLATSCAESTVAPTPESGKTKISVNLAYASSQTRAIEAPTEKPAEGTTVIDKELTNGYIYILDGEQIIYREPLNADALTLSDALATTQLVGEGKAAGGEDMLFPTTATVYVLANYPASIGDPSAFVTMADLEAASSTISYVTGAETNVNHRRPALGNSKGTPEGLSNITETTADAIIELFPLYTRVEVTSVTGGNWVSAFDLVGVYLDNYYPTFTMTGELVAASLQDNGQDETIGTKPGWFADKFEAGSELTWTPGTSLSPAQDQVWAYNLAAGNVPRIVIEIKNLKVFKDEGVIGTFEPLVDVNPEERYDDKFVTVKKFFGADGKQITALERGKIYQIETITFNRQAGTTPNVADVEVTAVVTVRDWILEATTVEID